MHLTSFDMLSISLQPILVYMSKVDGSFKFSPISVNFLTEVTKVLFAIVMLLCQVCFLICYLYIIIYKDVAACFYLLFVLTSFLVELDNWIYARQVLHY